MSDEARRDEFYERLRRGEAVGVRALARKVGIAPSTLYRAIERDEIEVTQIGTRKTIPAHVAIKLMRLPEAGAQAA